jgi:hypothetical protein
VGDRSAERGEALDQERPEHLPRGGALRLAVVHHVRCGHGTLLMRSRAAAVEAFSEKPLARASERR